MDHNSESKSNTTSVANEDYIKIDIEKPAKELAKLDDLLENITVVELMNNDSCYIIDIDKIEEYKNEYYLLDKKQSSLFVFNKDGKFLRKIGERGIGPEMYREISSFSLDKKREIIIIHSNNDMALIEYHLNGKFYNRTKIPFFAIQMIQVNNSTLGFHIGNNLSQDYNLVLTDLLGNVISEQFPIFRKHKPISYQEMGGIIKSQDVNLFNEVGSPIIYRFNESNTTPAYHIYLGKDAWTEEKKAELDLIFEKFSRGELSFLRNNFQENEKALLFEYFMNKRLDRGIYIKYSNNLYTKKNLKNNGLYKLFSISNMPSGYSENGELISNLNISALYYFREEFNDLYQELAITHPKLYQILETKDEMSNPILLIYDFK